MTSYEERRSEVDLDGPDAAHVLLAQIIDIVNRYQGRNPERAMEEIEAALLGETTQIDAAR